MTKYKVCKKCNTPIGCVHVCMPQREGSERRHKKRHVERGRDIVRRSHENVSKHPVLDPLREH